MSFFNSKNTTNINCEKYNSIINSNNRLNSNCSFASNFLLNININEIFSCKYLYTNFN